MDERAIPLREDLRTDPRWQLIQRIVESPSFARASRLSDFLLFISEKTLQGSGEELNEQEIGIKVFGRNEDYSRSDDNIVRTNATRVRQKLEEYFATTGQVERLRVRLPKGGYIPEFQTAMPAPRPDTRLDLSAATPSQPVEISPVHRKPRRSLLTVTAGILLLFTLANAWILRRNYQLYEGGKQKPVVHTDIELNRLWNLLFGTNDRTLIVPGDAGLNMYTNLDKRLVDVPEYTSGSYLNTPSAVSPPGFTGITFAARKYVSITDLELVSQLVRLPEAAHRQINIRFARDLRFDELKGNNAILLGSPNYNPWVRLFDRNLDFRMDYNGHDNTITVVNKAPKAGEQTSYIWSQSDPTRAGYALVALTDNLQNNGKVLLIEGTTSDGVLTASDTLFNSELMDPVIAAASNRGKLSNFEVLLKTTFYINGGAIKAQVVAEHIH